MINKYNLSLSRKKNMYKKKKIRGRLREKGRKDSLKVSPDALLLLELAI